jgi:hypothetical protein
MQTVGAKTWVIPEGYIPPGSMVNADHALMSHEAACILNAGKEDASVSITLYFADRKPAGPYRFTVPAERTRHLRFNDFSDPEPLPAGTDYASVIESDRPIVVQHTRLDSRAAEIALMSTMAWPAQ